MRAVVDTGTLIRGLVRRRGPPRPLLARLLDGQYTLVYSQPLLDELVDVLNRPYIRHRFHLLDADVATVLLIIAEHGEAVDPTRRVAVCRGPDDDKVLEAAAAGKADVIVSDDDGLLALGSFEDIPIVTPATFLAMLEGTRPA